MLLSVVIYFMFILRCRSSSCISLPKRTANGCWSHGYIQLQHLRKSIQFGHLEERYETAVFESSCDLPHTLRCPNATTEEAGFGNVSVLCLQRRFFITRFCTTCYRRQVVISQNVVASQDVGFYSNLLFLPLF